VAGYSAVIDLRVNGLEGLRTVSDRIESINRLIKQIKPVPTLFDQRGSAELKAAKQDLDLLVKKYADGGTQSARFATSIAGLNQQLTTFRSVAANAKTGSDQFTNALKAAEIASGKLAKAEIERLNTLNNLYTRQPTGRLTAEAQGPSSLTKDVLALGKNLPTSIAGLRSYASELDRVFNLVEAGSIDFRTLQTEIARVNNQLDIATGAGPLQGPALPPSMRGGRGRQGLSSPIEGGKDFPGSPGARSAMQENLMLGAGFPLLFGGGAGQVAGGLLGSFVGTGFGGQILGSAIGQQLEDATRRITEIGTALKELNMDNLRDSVIQVNADLDTTVSQLIAAGQADAARAEVSRQVVLQTGMLPEVVSDITNNTNLLGNTWNEFTGAVSGTLSILSAPFVTALTVIGQGLAKALQFVNLILGGVGLILKRAIELIGKIPFLQPILKFIEERTKAIAETEEQRLESARQITDQLSKELAANMQLQALESRRTLGRTTAEKTINAELDSQLQKNRINQEYASKAVELRKQLAATTDPRAQAELELALKQNEALRQQALTQQEIKDKLYAQGLEIEANTQKYDLAAEKINAQIAALDRGNEITQSRYSAEAALNDLYGVQLQRQYELAETAQQRMDIAIQMFTQQIKAAEIEYEQALNNNALLVKKAELEASIVELKYKQLEAEKAIALAQAKSRGNTPEEIRAISDAYNEGLGLQQEAVQAAYNQVAATEEIANNQNIVADAIYKSNVIQAESALAQKLVSDEIGLSAGEANKLAGELGAGAYTANQLASEMTNVAAQAAYAAQQIQNAINLQNMLNGGGNMNAGSTQAFAEGGYVTGPTQAIVGEGGEPEYVIPASKMSEAMGRYASGARGSSVIPDASNSTTSGYSAGTSSINPVVNVTTGPVMNMNNSNYVSQADFLAGLQAASRQGAQMALATLQNNSSTRRAVGVR